MRWKKITCSAVRTCPPYDICRVDPTTKSRPNILLLRSPSCSRESRSPSLLIISSPFVLILYFKRQQPLSHFPRRAVQDTCSFETEKRSKRPNLFCCCCSFLACSLIGSMSNTLLRVHPSELKIPYEVRRKRSCCMQLTNKTNQYVAFKVKTTNPRKYSVRHACGILLPRSSCDITVTMQAPNEVLFDYHCKDKFLVQSVVVRHGATMRDFVPELFTKAPGRVIEEFKMRVVYIAANPPSPVPEEEEEDASPRSDVMSYEVKMTSVFDSGASVESTLVAKREYSVEENQKLEKQMELLGAARSSQQGFSVMFVLLVFMSSVCIGHLMKHIKV
uniref:MSP domain-containing protein n=1 Tax=Leersia perrieri TaxID=77586 RepID=A0A0D9W7Z9_9ORYZ